MEQILEKIEEPKEIEPKPIPQEEKKYFRILGITLWRLFAYFIIYSVIGFVVETIFCIAKYGTIESRQSFLYGPFCAIYGVGAIIMILSLQYFKKSYNTLFIGGFIVGSITEYLVSWIGEMILHLKWWDYSNAPLNINGRVCLLYSIFWGFLGLYLMIFLNPKVDRFINFVKEKVSIKFLQTFVSICILFMLLDCIATAFGLSYFTIRVIKENNIEVKNQEYIDKAYDRIYNNEWKVKLINKFLNDEKMLKTFPRLTVKDVDGNIIYVRELYPEIQTYYYKFSAKRDRGFLTKPIIKESLAFKIRKREM